MRLQLSKLIEKDAYFLHADMWNIKRFPIKGKVINVGLGESNLLNIAAGLASEGKIVYIYGVCGFVIHRYEQLKFSCKYFGSEKGKIIILNAGKYGYENLGIGHKLDDDIDLLKILKIPYYIPKNLEEFKIIIKDLKEYNKGIYYIQLGRDYE